jgi:NADH-ubiquinone oxidoreductase chain 4
MEENSIENKSKMKNIAITTSLINFFISILLWVQFDSSYSGYQFVSEFNQISFLHFNLGVDGISLYYVLLTTFITPIAIISNYNLDEDKNLKLFLISFLILETLQIAVFVVLDLLLFYIFFESVLPILFIIINVYGSGPNRSRSANLFFLYTLAGSLFMLLAILQIYNNLGSTDFTLISLNEISLDSQKILWLSVSFSKRNMTSRIIKKNNNTLNLLERFPRANKNYLPSNNNCKDIVIHGSNLASTVNYPRYNSIIRHMVKIPSNLDSIILGILISDGWLYINKAGNTLLGFKQSINK